MSFLAERKRANKTQAEVAERLKVSTGAVSQWENKQSYPRAAMLLEIAAFYGCTVDDLLKEDSV